MVRLWRGAVDLDGDEGGTGGTTRLSLFYTDVEFGKMTIKHKLGIYRFYPGYYPGN